MTFTLKKVSYFDLQGILTWYGKNRKAQLLTKRYLKKILYHNVPFVQEWDLLIA